MYLVPLQIPKFVVKIPLVSAADVRSSLLSFMQLSLKPLFSPIHLKVLSFSLIGTLYDGAIRRVCPRRILAIRYNYYYTTYIV